MVKLIRSRTRSDGLISRVANFGILKMHFVGHRSVACSPTTWPQRSVTFVAFYAGP